MHALALALVSLIIDGKLDDPFWKKVPAAPFSGAGGGEVRAVVAGRYFYVAASLPEPSGRVTARSIGHNPAWEDEDLLRIYAGADIGYLDRTVNINPLGAYSLERSGHPVWKSLEVFPYSDERTAPVLGININRFLVASRIEEKSWTVEVAFPLSELSAPSNDRIFATIERIRASRPGSPQQVWRWPVKGPAEKIGVDRSVRWGDPPPAFRPPALGNQEPPIEVAKTASLPPLDSGWNDAPWRDTPAWRLQLDEPHPRWPRVPTEVKLLHDGKTLAVFAQCTEPEKLVAQVRENDGAVDQDDNFALYLATSGSMYAQFVVNPLGYLRDAAGFTGGNRISRPREWDSGAAVRATVQEGAWLVRIDVPLEKVADALGEDRFPSEWRMLLVRQRRQRPGDAAEISMLPTIESETATAASRYRRMRLSAASRVQAPRPNIAEPSPLTYVLTSAERSQVSVVNMVDRNLRARARTYLATDWEAWQQVNSREAWEKFRDARLGALRKWMSEFPAHTQLDTRITKEFAGQGYRRQDLIFQSRPGLWVTANLYVPERPSTGRPGMVILHSHHRPRWQAELQDMGILWARLGCEVLIMDQIDHGERIQTYPWNREGYHARYNTGMQMYVAGESLIQWMVWDTMRGIDLLLTHKEVDPKKIILLGAVAAGGEPAAITAALDPRVAAAAPFTYGEAIPERGNRPSDFHPFPDPGWGSWETTRNLPRSIRDGFLPWVINASVAPRRLVFSYEMGWEVEKVPAWHRYRKIFGLYGLPDNLDEAHGFGGFPGPGECANIGPAQRRTLYPELKRWFGIPIPEEEPADRRPEAELAALERDTAARVGMKAVHELLREKASARVRAARVTMAALGVPERREWLRKKWSALLGDIEPNGNPAAVTRWKKQDSGAEAEGVTLEVEPGIIVPVVLLRPSGAKAAGMPVVTVISQAGRGRLLANRRAEIDALLASGVAICLPDLRGIGETAPDRRRHPLSAGITLAATELMLGNTMVGARLKDLRTVLSWLEKRPGIDSKRMALWGDADVPPNPRRRLIEEVAGWRIGPEITRDAEPLGGLLALLGGLFEERVAAVAVHRGLVGYLSMLDDSFLYVPSDAIVPDSASAGDLAYIAGALAPKPLLLDELVDGRNTVLPDAELKVWVEPAVAAYRSQPRALSLGAAGGVARWIAAELE
ncbi:MAG: acetylxylan esterase [Bryobacteraceae bacterium]